MPLMVHFGLQCKFQRKEEFDLIIFGCHTIANKMKLELSEDGFVKSLTGQGMILFGLQCLVLGRMKISM